MPFGDPAAHVWITASPLPPRSSCSCPGEDRARALSGQEQRRIQTQKVPFPNDQGSQPWLPIMEVAASDVRLTRIPYA